MVDFTPRAQQALALARKEAARLHHDYAGPEHLLLGLIKLGQGGAVNVLQKLGLDLETIRIEVEKQVGLGPVPESTPFSKSTIPYTPRFKNVLALAGKEAKALNSHHIGTVHFLLGLLHEGDGVAARVLRTMGIDMEQTRAEIIKELDSSEMEKKPLFVPVGEADLIRQELAVLKSRVETISLTVDEASRRSRPPATDQVTSSLRQLSDPQTPPTLNALTRFLNYALWFAAFVWLVRLIVNRFRKF
ncbi:MAG: hypothetical protein LV481_13730 [Methylacidiphilales bacterium]|nr:hypothetical protein [Candidatus Methylacidiphilales bacterium]